MLRLEVATKTDGNLETYRTKRNAARTPEPFSSSLPASFRFVVQQHAARALHYDFRLEWQGVLKSWAVPKGPSPNPADKRLAVAVEDHPLEYANFEGLIPQGNYGAGAVIVWDRGSWVALNDPAAGLESGKLLFELRGYKLRGRWTLVKTRRGPKDWLLIKERDQYAAPLGTEGYPAGSVLSGLTVFELRDNADLSAPLVAKLDALGMKRARRVSHGLSPMLAVPSEPFSAPGWIYEIKYDGYRVLAEKAGAKVTLSSRAGHDLTAIFPEVADVIARLPFDRFVIDGEVIVHDQRGLPSFARLQKRGRLARRSDIERAAVEHPATYYVFDLLAAQGYDLRTLPLSTRKELLRAIVPQAGPLRYCDHIAERGEAMFTEVKQLGLEGIVAKRADSRYVCRRSSDWRKISAEKADDFVIVGYTEPKRTPRSFGALLLAQYDDGELVFAGRVGAGFDRQSERALEKLVRSAPRGAAPARAPHDATLNWIESGCVAAVKFKERTAEGLLRQPAFLRLRDDKVPQDCRAPAALAAPPEPPLAPPPDPRATRRLDLTNLDKVFWSEKHLTKGDLLAYYREIAPWLLPYLKDRPVVLTRYPDGIEGKSFFQKDAPVYAPDWMRIETMWSEQARREIRYFVLDDADSLLYVANMASIPLHVWSSRVGSLERPDWSVLDLDPKGAPLTDVVKIARFVHRLCADIGLEHFVKTSGSTGLHILIPLAARYTYEQSRTLAELIARLTVEALDEIATITRSVERREGKVYIDYLQNGHGRLLVAPFSARPLPAAPVSMPLRWPQVTSRLSLERFTIENAARIVARAGDPMAGILTAAADVPGALQRLEMRLAQRRS
jgi:bifunctional non-homologous end joining protein LigD